MTNTHSSIFVLLSLVVPSLVGGTAAAQSAAVNTSQWKCERCPFPKAGTAQLEGAVDGGIAVASGTTRTSGDWTGYDRNGVYALVGGDASYRAANGYRADVSAADLGLDTRSLDARAGREGLYELRLNYAELPRRFAEGAQTPFLGAGSTVLTLPAGYPAITTAAMPLAGTLQPVAIDLKHSQLGLGASVVSSRWTYSLDVRRDKRDGMRPGYGSFFSTAAQLPLPVDEVTDQLEAGATYTGSTWHLGVRYLFSQFKNGNDALTWSNPFSPVAGATVGQLALAPDNRFQQLAVSGGWQVMPALQASADLAVGRGTQDASLLPSTLNGSLAGVAPLPAATLDGQVNTLNASVKLTATPMRALRITGGWFRDVRDNKTPVRSWQQVATDMFVGAARSNTPFDLTRDRFKLAADYRGPGTWRLAGGVDWDQKERNYQEVLQTRETTVWGRVGVRPVKSVSLGFNAAVAKREASEYGIAYWFPDAQNPALRKFNLAERDRTKFGASVEWSPSDVATVTLSGEVSDDDYPDTTIGLKEARTSSVNLGLTLNLSEATQLQAYAAMESVRSVQEGSQVFAAADWTGRYKDRFQLFGLSIRHAAIADKLDIGADLSISRAKGDVSVQTRLLEPDYPTRTTHFDTARLWAQYRLTQKLWLNGSWSYQSVETVDWAFDGVGPGSVFNLLAFGSVAPRHNVSVLRSSLRYRF